MHNVRVYDDNCPKHSSLCSNCLIKFVEFRPCHFLHHFVDDFPFETSVL